MRHSRYSNTISYADILPSLSPIKQTLRKHNLPAFTRNTSNFYRTRPKLSSSTRKRTSLNTADTENKYIFWMSLDYQDRIQRRLNCDWPSVLLKCPLSLPKWITSFESTCLDRTAIRIYVSSRRWPPPVLRAGIY